MLTSGARRRCVIRLLRPDRPDGLQRLPQRRCRYRPASRYALLSASSTSAGSCSSAGARSSASASSDASAGSARLFTGDRTVRCPWCQSYSEG